MPTTSNVPFPRYSRQDNYRFAHFGKGDAETWRKFLASDLADKYIGFDYDIKVGEHALNSLGSLSSDARLESGTLAKRIDVVAFNSATSVDLVEVKANKIHSAVGQVLAYKQLFVPTYPDLSINQLIIVTAFDDSELIRFAQSFGILVFVLS